MKFRFCGDLDAPDWLLKEITVLSKISVVRIRLLCKELISFLSGGPIDYEKVKKQVLTHHPTWGASDVKAAVSAMNFIFTNATKYAVDPVTLSTELQQLGLPKEHGDSIAKPYQANKDKLRAHFSKQTLQLPRLESIDWRVDYLLASSFVSDLNQPSIQLKFTTTDGKQRAFDISADKLRVLLHELRIAREEMTNL